jgi:hypothetical protein
MGARSQNLKYMFKAFEIVSSVNNLDYSFFIISFIIIFSLNHIKNKKKSKNYLLIGI